MTSLTSMALGVAIAVLTSACESNGRVQSTGWADSPSAQPPVRISQRSSAPIHVESLPESDPPVFVVRGGAQQPGKLVFLHGMCGHGLGYAQSFQHAAARRGTLIAPQADIMCGRGPGAKWTMNVPEIDKRITLAFKKLGEEEPISDICVIGMSQGATRAAALARAYPERYTRLISMGAPTEVKSPGLERLRAAVLMVGQRERKDLMLLSQQSLKRVGVPAHTMVIPDADHAGMGPTPEKTMDEALAWLWDHSRPEKEKSRP